MVGSFSNKNLNLPHDADTNWEVNKLGCYLSLLVISMMLIYLNVSLLGNISDTLPFHITLHQLWLASSRNLWLKLPQYSQLFLPIIHPYQFFLSYHCLYPLQLSFIMCLYAPYFPSYTLTWLFYTHYKFFPTNAEDQTKRLHRPHIDL